MFLRKIWLKIKEILNKMFKFSERAYAKMIFHAAKYPHLAVNGVLLASKTENEIIDAIPLFHQCLYVTPMVEIALMQVCKLK